MTTARTHKRDGWIPYYFVAFFVVLALVDGIMVTLAVRTHSGTVTDHPYEKGLAYNQTVQAAEAQDKLGWSSELSYAPSDSGGTLSFRLYDAQKKSLIPGSARASFSRPAQQGMDFSQELKDTETPVRLPASGVWDVRVFADHKGTVYQRSLRIVVP